MRLVKQGIKSLVHSGHEASAALSLACLTPPCLPLPNPPSLTATAFAATLTWSLISMQASGMLTTAKTARNTRYHGEEVALLSAGLRTTIRRHT